MRRRPIARGWRDGVLVAGPLRLRVGAIAWWVWLAVPGPGGVGFSEHELAHGMVDWAEPGDTERAAEDAARGLVLGWFAAFDPDGAALAALDAGARSAHCGGRR